MFEKIGIDVLKLRRVSIGRLKIGSVKKGEIRQIPPETAFRVFA
jgi:16S rRNA U516 pseudouridylate synthase RsuA-like enzyme